MDDAAVALGYIRVSTEDQSLHGVSLEAQEHRVRSYCEALGYTLELTIREEGTSAKIPLAKRPGGKQLFARIDQGGVRYVVVWKLDRLFRNASDALTVSDRMRAQGVELCFITESINTSTPQGQFFYTLTAAFAELERAMIAERTRYALQHKRSTGKVFGSTPLGYRREGDALFDDPRERALLTRLHRMHESGQSLRRIAAILNEEGMPTKQRGIWHASTVRHLLARSY